MMKQIFYFLEFVTQHIMNDKFTVVKAHLFLMLRQLGRFPVKPSRYAINHWTLYRISSEKYRFQPKNVAGLTKYCLKWQVMLPT